MSLYDESYIFINLTVSFMEVEGVKNAYLWK